MVIFGIILCSLLVPSIAFCDEAFDNQLIEDVNSATVTNSKNTEWTSWNKFWLVAAIGGQTFDIVSTQAALDRGCKEGNSLYGSDPSVGLMLLVKVALLGVTITGIEYLVIDKEKQDVRNIAFSILSVIGAGAGAYNYSVDCN